MRKRPVLADVLLGLAALLLGVTACPTHAQGVAAPGAFHIAVDVAMVPDQSLRGRVQLVLPPHVGAAVMVRTDGETVFKEVYGSRKLGEPALVKSSTAFRLASATKPFTAAAALKLVETYKLQLDDRLGRFFDGLPDETAAITVEQLLTHRSRLPFYYRRMAEADAPEQPAGERYYTDADVLQWLRRDEELLPDPGAIGRYNDTNYVVLALVVEAAAGKPFEDYLREAILEPAGMDGAAVLAGDSEPAERAYGHNRVRGNEGTPRAAIEKLTGDERVQALGAKVVSALVQQVVMKSRGYDVDDQSGYSRMRGDGCLYASIDDLEAWFEALDAGRVLSEASLMRMTSPVGGWEARGRYSCGWTIETGDGGPRLFNGGATRGFCQSVQWWPERDVVVAVLINTDGEWSIDDVGERVLAMVAAE
ncbi:MAG: serine hydrolase domain-containing protein [Planctomycetota bacterium]